MARTATPRRKEDLVTTPATLAPPIRGATIYSGVCARVHGPGDPLLYTESDGRQRREYRDEINLRRLADGLVDKPFRRAHGTETIGKVLACRVEGGKAIATVAVTDQRALDEIAAGTAELSVGYGVHLDATGYQQVDSVEELSLVPRARCGPSCRLRTHDDQLDERALGNRLRADLGRAWRIDCGCGCGGGCTADAPVESLTESQLAERNRADLAAAWMVRS
jgi:hypothetical protein